MESLPTIDLSAFKNGTDAERQAIARQVDEICRTIGFIIIENHGFPTEVKSAAWNVAQSFFQETDVVKRKSYPSDHGNPRGYLPIEGENLGKTLGLDTQPDRKETFNSGPLSSPEGHVETKDFHFYYGSNIWPISPNNFEQRWTNYYKEMEKFGAELMTLFALALKLDENYFVKYHTHHISALRCQYYPTISNDAAPGQLRAGEHSDYGTVTILNPDPNVGGLEVKSKNGNWIKAPVLKNAFIINIGDMMAHWTNNRWVSTLHRVVEPENILDVPSPARQSIAYFMNPNYDAEIKTIPTCVKDGNTSKYAPVLAGKYLMNKFNSSL
ncbi:MAG: 2-oxoglutarate and iron-dependent oxygenase domain-containing protein [Emcibacteraceae bacterium]|nr:2-oxoglutarate and iron-dependent oxygenase domain-containing protein [Emcibacteraceae bacterium]